MRSDFSLKLSPKILVSNESALVLVSPHDD